MSGQPATVEHLNIEALSGLLDDAPVTMLNLMRFRDRSLNGNGGGSGWDAYLRYSALAINSIKAHGGTITWTGTAEAVALGQAEQNRWNYVALVRYPSRAAFIAIITSSDHSQANFERENGCEAHTILAIRETYNRLSSPQKKE